MFPAKIKKPSSVKRVVKAIASVARGSAKKEAKVKKLIKRSAMPGTSAHRPSESLIGTPCKLPVAGSGGNKLKFFKSKSKDGNQCEYKAKNDDVKKDYSVYDNLDDDDDGPSSKMAQQKGLRSGKQSQYTVARGGVYSSGGSGGKFKRSPRKIDGETETFDFPDENVSASISTRLGTAKIAKRAKLSDSESDVSVVKRAKHSDSESEVAAVKRTKANSESEDDVLLSGGRLKLAANSIKKDADQEITSPTSDHQPSKLTNRKRMIKLKSKKSKSQQPTSLIKSSKERFIGKFKNSRKVKRSSDRLKQLENKPIRSILKQHRAVKLVAKVNKRVTFSLDGCSADGSHSPSTLKTDPKKYSLFDYHPVSVRSKSKVDVKQQPSKTNEDVPTAAKASLPEDTPRPRRSASLTAEALMHCFFESDLKTAHHHGESAGTAKPPVSGAATPTPVSASAPVPIQVAPVKRNHDSVDSEANSANSSKKLKPAAVAVKIQSANKKSVISKEKKKKKTAAPSEKPTESPPPPPPPSEIAVAVASGADKDAGDNRRRLRDRLGLRSVGQYWDNINSCESSDDSAKLLSTPAKKIKISKKSKPDSKKPNKNDEPTVKTSSNDSLSSSASTSKDEKPVALTVTGKRLASLNAQAIMKATYEPISSSGKRNNATATSYRQSPLRLDSPVEQKHSQSKIYYDHSSSSSSDQDDVVEADDEHGSSDENSARVLAPSKINRYLFGRRNASVSSSDDDEPPSSSASKDRDGGSSTVNSTSGSAGGGNSSGNNSGAGNAGNGRSSRHDGSTSNVSHHVSFVAGRQLMDGSSFNRQDSAIAESSDAFPSQTTTSSSSKSYAPLAALSSMQPPSSSRHHYNRQQRRSKLRRNRAAINDSVEVRRSPFGRRSAFSPPEIRSSSSGSPTIVRSRQPFAGLASPRDSVFSPSFYQPAGPLIAQYSQYQQSIHLHSQSSIAATTTNVMNITSPNKIPPSPPLTDSTHRASLTSDNDMMNDDNDNSSVLNSSSSNNCDSQYAGFSSRYQTQSNSLSSPLFGGRGQSPIHDGTGTSTLIGGASGLSHSSHNLVRPSLIPSVTYYPTVIHEHMVPIIPAPRYHHRNLPNVVPTRPTNDYVRDHHRSSSSTSSTSYIIDRQRQLFLHSHHMSSIPASRHRFSTTTSGESSSYNTVLNSGSTSRSSLAATSVEQESLLQFPPVHPEPPSHQSVFIPAEETAYVRQPVPVQVPAAMPYCTNYASPHVLAYVRREELHQPRVQWTLVNSEYADQRFVAIRFANTQAVLFKNEPD